MSEFLHCGALRNGRELLPAVFFFAFLFLDYNSRFQSKSVEFRGSGHADREGDVRRSRRTNRQGDLQERSVHARDVHFERRDCCADLEKTARLNANAYRGLQRRHTISHQLWNDASDGELGPI
jgi:hypothetical protein